MIRYALTCDQGHAFESWFQNSATYDKQVRRGLVTCPVCGSAKVEKTIMAPRWSRRMTPVDRVSWLLHRRVLPQPSAA